MHELGLDIYGSCLASVLAEGLGEGGRGVDKELGS